MSASTSKAQTAAQTQRIARLYAEGHSTQRIMLIARCARARVEHVAALYGYHLDAAGILPRPHRPAVTPGQPVPKQPAGMPATRATRPLPPIPAAPPAPSRKGRPRTQTGQCTTPGCVERARTMGMCGACYMRARRAAS